MQGILKVDPQKLISTSEEFNATGGQIRGLTEQMPGDGNGCGAVWRFRTHADCLRHESTFKQTI